MKGPPSQLIMSQFFLDLHRFRPPVLRFYCGGPLIPHPSHYRRLYSRYEEVGYRWQSRGGRLAGERSNLRWDPRTSLELTAIAPPLGQRTRPRDPLLR